MVLKPIRIGLLWHSPNSGNLGVGALTIANMAIVSEVALAAGFEPKFTVLGMRDSGATYVAPEAADVFVLTWRTLLSPSGFWAALGRLDCVLDIGAGDSFAEIYGPRRFFFLWFTKMLTIWRGKPLLLSPQTIGPFSRFLYRALAAVAMNGAKAVVARDRASLDAVQAIAHKAKSLLSLDVAFALPYEDQSRLRGANGRLRVGVNVSGLLFSEAETGRNRFGLEADYAQLTRRFVADLAQRSDVEVHLLAHVFQGGEGADDDGAACDRLASEYPGTIRVGNFRGPMEAKSYISGLDFLVAGRMHACIAAFSSGTPVAPVAYSRKFSGLFAMLDYDWMVPVRGADTDQALTYLQDCLTRRDELARQIAEGMGKVEALLDVYRAELRDFLPASVK